MRGIIIAGAVSVLAIAGSASAQYPFGHATPIGGTEPELYAGPLWFGNLDYGYRIEDAPPGGIVQLLVSTRRNDLVLGGLQVYPSLAAHDTLFFLTASIDGGGRAFIPQPLAGPDVPALAGLDLYAQAAVSDPLTPGVLGATQGLLLEVTLHPVFAFATYDSGLALMDVLLGTATSVSGIPASAEFNEGAFGNGGRDLAVATSDGFFLIDTLSSPPTVVASIPGSFSSVAWDRVRNRVWADYPFTGTIHVVDGDRTSPTFGTSLHEVSRFASWMSISGDGDTLALATFSGGLEFLDSNPGSPSYLQIASTPPSPIPYTFGTTVGRARMSPDGRIVSIPVIQAIGTAQSSLHRFDTLVGQWIDHDSVTPGTQPISSSSIPGVPVTFDFAPTRDGSAAYLIGSSDVLRMDHSLSSPLTIAMSATSIPAPVFGETYLGVSPSGRFLVKRQVHPLGGSTPNVLSLVPTAAGAELALATLGPGSSSQIVAAWR